MAGHHEHPLLTAAEFIPIEESRARHRRRLGLGLGLGLPAAMAAIAAMAFLLSAKAVIFHLTPAHAKVDISGLDFNLGSNYLVLPGKHSVTVSVEGYTTAEEALEISSEDSRELTIVLQPLPGNLQVVSSQRDISVVVDGEEAGRAPGLVENIAAGDRVIRFVKYRYFPLEKTLAIEGRGRTQSIEVALQPAWGWLELSSEPSGADILVDDKLIAKTPAKVEILETGSAVQIAAKGYKTWQQTLTVKAGTTSANPRITLAAADGTLDIATTPTGAGVTVDGRYAGASPVQVPVSPLRPHRVELFLEGYLKATRQVEVNSEATAALKVNLEPSIGNIELAVTPADAQVLVDGRVQGAGSQTLSLPARKHRLEVRKSGYQVYQVEILPNPRQRQSLDIALLTVQQAHWAERPATIQSPVAGTLKLMRPSGAFMLGAPRREAGRRANEAERLVELKRPFYIGDREITNRQFRQWQETHSSTSLKGQTLDMDDQPVAMVSWQDAALFCNWLSEQAGLSLFYQVSDGTVSGFNWRSSGYRLPTEAEWAWAAQIDGEGKRVMFPWPGDRYPPEAKVENYADRHAANLVNFILKDYVDGYPTAAAVASFAPNQRGLYDLGGNVSEWVNDYYDVQGHQGKPLLDYRGPDAGNRHGVRGASWALASRADIRLAARRAGSGAELDIGFRIARYVDELESEQ